MSKNGKILSAVPKKVWETNHTNACNCGKSSTSVTDAHGNGYPQQKNQSSDCSSKPSDCHNC